MKAQTFKEILQIIEDWYNGTREEGRLCEVTIFCGNHRHTCSAYNFLDYCTAEGNWEERDEVGYNTGLELCLFELDSITAIKVNLIDKED